MKKILAVAALAAFQFAVAQQTTKELKEFTILAVSGNIEMAIMKSSENKMVIEDESNVLKVASEAGALAISNDSGETVEIVLYYSGNLENIAVSGPSEIFFKDKIKTQNLNVSVAGGSEISIMVDTQNINIDAASGSEIKVSGKAMNFGTNVASGAEVSADELISENGNCVVASGGEAAVHVTGNLNATVASGGELTVYGNPRNVHETKADDGEINIIK